MSNALVQQFYVGYYGRPADVGGITYWSAQLLTSGGDFTAIQDQFADSSEYEQFVLRDEDGNVRSDADLVNFIYNNCFGRDADADGLAFYEAGLENGDFTLISIVKNIIDGAQNEDLAIFANKLEVAQYVTDNLGDRAYTENDIPDARALLASVTDERSTVDAAKAAADLWIGDGGGGGDVTTFTLTQLADLLTGTENDDVFLAPVTQNQTGSGQLANTFETGDILDGGAGRDILRADLIATGTIQDNLQGAAIGATTTSIEEVYLTAITPQIDTANNTTAISTIDAGRMAGVEQWWTDESRSNIRIEDVRTRPEDTTLGMRLTDPQVAYEVYFNPLFMEGELISESALTIRVQEITDGVAPEVNELANITVREINFDLAGVSYTLDTENMRAANTWAQLEAGIADALLAQEDLAGLNVSHTGNGVFVIEDPAGGVFAIEDGEALIFGAAADIDVRNRVDVGRISEEGMISSTLVVDGVGAGSRGGIVNIAAMSGDRGVEVLDVLVDRDSGITSLSSVNSPNTVNRSFDQENQLEEVYLSHLDGGAQGDFELGLRTFDSQGVSTTTDNRLQTNGLTDVRIFDATGFDAALKVGASLTAAVFDKYLLGVSEPVQFSYLLGDGGSNLNLAVDNGVAGDPDFLLEVIGGAEADRINLAGLAVKQQTTIDGGGDDVIDTLEVNTSTGWAATQNGEDIVVANPATDLTAAETSFASVTNIEKLVINSNLNTTHDLVAGGLGDVDDIIIATQNVNTRLVNLDADEQAVIVSGKNQTLGAGNNNNNQNFGTVRFTDTTGEELDLQLANTARVSGVLTVNALTIDNQVGNVSEVRTLILDSDGVRTTSNVVTTLNGNLVNTFMLEGTQNLTITNLASASNSISAIAANRDNLLVDASGLGTFNANGDLVDAANLYLGVTGAVITAIDAALGTNRTVELIGTEGERDILNIRDGVTTTNATTISEFETIRFGQGAVINVATNFNATNVSDVELYDLWSSTAAINLFNLRSTEDVRINTVNTVNGTAVRMDVTLQAANPTAGSQVNVDFAATTPGVAGAVDAGFWGIGAANLNVRDFSTISLDMGGRAGDSYNYNFDLNTLPNATVGSPTFGLVNARTLEITGGQFDAGFLNVDSLTLNELDTALTLVDFSDYSGDFVTNGWDDTVGSNAEVVANQFGMNFDIGGDNTLFAVGAAGIANTAEQQTVAFAAGFGDLAIDATITLAFAGGEYTFTNDTGAVIPNADIVDAIFADAANAPTQFTITQSGGVGTAIELNAVRFGDMPVATAAVTSTDVLNIPGNMVILNDVILGDRALGIPTEFVTVESEFLTKFTFTEDAYDQGVVWQIDNFQPFDGVDNVTLNTQTQIDLRQLGVDSSTKITIEAGDVFLAGLSAADILAYDAINNAGAPGWIAGLGVAGNTFITSNAGLDFTILLTGVDSTTLGNENIVGVA